MSLARNLANLVQAMTVDPATGRLGVGTTSTLGNSLVNVALGLTVRNQSTTTGYFQTYNANAGTNLKTWRFGGNDSGNLVFETVNDAYSSSTGRMTLDASGNLVLGTTSASGRLTIDSGSAGLMGSFNSTNANGGYFTLSTSGTVYGDIGTAFQAVSGSASDFAINARGARNLVFGTNNNERARIDSSGNLGLGVTPSAWGAAWKAIQIQRAAFSSLNSQLSMMSQNFYSDGSNDKYIAQDYALRYYQYNGTHYWQTAATGSAGSNITWASLMALDASGRLLLGTTSALGNLTIGDGSGSTSTASYLNAGTGGNSFIGRISGSNTWFVGDTVAAIGSGTGMVNYVYGSNPWIVYTGGSERVRVDSSGNLLVGSTNPSTAVGVGFKINADPTVPNVGQVINTSGASNTYHFYNLNATNNGYRFYVKVDGGVVNYSANNSNLSDERTKTDIQDAGNYLTKICAIPVRTFKYKDQDNDLLNLGVIAQEVEAIAPELVDVSGFGETPEDGVPLKAIYQTDLQYALMKCIQEQQAIIESLTQRVAALEA